MSDEDQNKKITAANITAPQSSAVGAWGATVRTKAKTRLVEAENALGAALVQHQQLQAALAEATGDAVRAAEKNRDLDSIRLQAQMEVQGDLVATEVRLQELDFKKNKLDAEANEIISKHNANVAENKATQVEAEARKLQAENDKLLAQINLITNQKKLQRLQSNTAREQDELSLRDTLAKLQDQLKQAEGEAVKLNDPILDEDEGQPMRQRQVQRNITSLKEQIAAAQRQLDELT